MSAGGIADRVITFFLLRGTGILHLTLIQVFCAHNGTEVLIGRMPKGVISRAPQRRKERQENYGKITGKMQVHPSLIIG